VYKLAWLYAFCGPQQLCTTRMVADQAARAGSITGLMWLKRTQQGLRFHTGTCATAAEHNQLSVLQHLQSEGYQLGVYVLSAAARSGLFSLLRWAAERSPLWQEFDFEDSQSNLLEDAAFGGNTELLEWLKQQLPQLPCDEYVMGAAVEGGHVAMCEHLRATGCPWSDNACEEAAQHDQHQTLHWLRESGCPCDAAAVGAAAATFANGVQVLAYLLQAGLLSAALLTQLLDTAGRAGNLAAAQWLRQQGAEWPAMLERWYDYDQLDDEITTLAWARAEGCTAPTA
jgi:hypothetical protein